MSEAVGLEELLVAIPTPRKDGAQIQIRLNDWGGLNVDCRVWRPNKDGVYTPLSQGVRLHDREGLETLRDALNDVLSRGLDWDGVEDEA